MSSIRLWKHRSGGSESRKKIAEKKTPEEEVLGSKVPEKKIPGKKVPLESTPEKKVPRKKIPGRAFFIVWCKWSRRVGWIDESKKKMFLPSVNFSGLPLTENMFSTIFFPGTFFEDLYPWDLFFEDLFSGDFVPVTFFRGLLF